MTFRFTMRHILSRQRVLEARWAVRRDAERMQAEASAYHELVVAQKRRAREFLERQRCLPIEQVLLLLQLPPGVEKERRTAKRARRAQRRAVMRQLFLAVASSTRAAREARQELTKSLAARQMIEDSVRRQGLAEMLLSSSLVHGSWHSVDIAASPRKLRGPNPAGRPRLVVRLREQPL